MSKITGNWLIQKFNDGTRGNLTVEGVITAESNISAAGNITASGAISAPTVNAPNLAPVIHYHAGEDITSGTISAARLPAATALVQGAVILSTESTVSGDAGSETKAATVRAAEIIAQQTVDAIPKGEGTSTYGLIKLAGNSGLNLTAGAISVITGNGTEISSGAIRVKAQTAGGIGVNSGGVYLDTAAAASLLALGSAANKNAGTAPGNVPILDANGKIPGSLIPPAKITEIFYAASESEMISLSQAGQYDFCIRTDLSRTFYLASAEPGAYADPENWVEILTPTDLVQSVNGYQGTVLLGITDIYAAGTDKFTGIESAGLGDSYRVPTWDRLTAYAAQKSHTHTSDALTDLVISAAGITDGEGGAATAGAVYEFVSGGYSPIGHTHTSAAVTDAATDADGISSTAQELTQARAVYDYIDKTVQREALTPLSGNVIPITRSGENFLKETAAPITMTIDTSGIEIGEGEAVSFRLFIVTTGSGAVTLPAFNWAGTAPEINAPGTYIIDAITVDQGWSWGARAEYYTYPDNPLLHRGLPLPTATGGAAEIAIEDGFLEYHLPINSGSGDSQTNALTIAIDTGALAFDATDEQRRGFFAEIFLEIAAGNYTPPAVTFTGIDGWADFTMLPPRLDPGATYVVQIFSLDAGETITAAFIDKRI